MIVVRAPFRLPLGGGGTDLPEYYTRFGGRLVTAAINKYMYININTPAFLRHICVKYSKTETVDHVDDIKHDLVRETLKYLDFTGSVEISSMADAGAGTGLGSSGAFVVGLLQGMNCLLRRSSDKLKLAQEASHIEIVRAGSPIGVHDQYASAIGGIFSMTIEPDGVVDVRPLELDKNYIAELQYRLVMFSTGISRSASEILQDQQKRVAANSEQTTNAMHEIKEIGIKIESALVGADVDSLGKLMHQHWLTKKKISDKMSNQRIDAWYDVAMKNGALGGKIMGAGGGGFFVFCCESGRRQALVTALEATGLELVDFAFDFHGAKVMVDV